MPGPRSWPGCYDPPLMAVGIPLGPYRLVRRLASGGMAEIFLARQEGKDGFARDLVVKRILPHLVADPEFTRMFRDEAKLAALSVITWVTRCAMQAA